MGNKILACIRNEKINGGHRLGFQYISESARLL